MTVKELKKEIIDLPDEMEVIMQKDGEGNGYSPLSYVDHNAVYIPETTWNGEVYFTEWSAEDACMNEKEWEDIKSKPQALILGPVN